MFVYDNVEWAKNEKFRPYWNCYKVCEQWRKNHLEISRKAESLAGPSSSAETQKSSLPTAKISKNRAKLNKSNKRHNSTIEIEEEEEEISQEMKDFYEITLKHRRERDRKRAEEMEKEQNDKEWLKAEDIDYINAEKISIRGRSERSAKHKDEQAEVIKKREEAKKLYGKSAEKILAMETVIELQFEHVYAENKPQMWPNIPLRL